jgi:signal transduction histidine kinase
MWKPWPSDELAGRPLPRLDAEGRGKPPPGLYVLRAFGLGSIVLIVVMTLATDPRPGLRGEGVAILLLLIAWLAGLAAAMLPLEQTSAVRGAGLAVVGATTVALMAFQPDSAAFAGIYFVVVLSAMTLPGPPALALSAATLAGELVVIAADGPHHSAGSAMGLTFGMIPWFLVIRLMRRLRQRSDDALALVEELRESRAAHAQSAALAERGRVARELHDVLAHSLSALALQLEGTRLMAADRGTDPQVVDAIHRAHHLAAAGLTEARQAIAALTATRCPGPSGCPSWPTRSPSTRAPPAPSCARAPSASTAPRRGSPSTAPRRRR